MKGPVTDWENMFANQIANKGLMYRTYNKFSKLYDKQTIQLENWQKKKRHGATGTRPGLRRLRGSRRVVRRKECLLHWQLPTVHQRGSAGEGGLGDARGGGGGGIRFLLATGRALILKPFLSSSRFSSHTSLERDKELSLSHDKTQSSSSL